MITNKAMVIITVLAVFFSSAHLAFAQYGQYDTDTKDRMQENKDLAQQAVKIATQNPHTGSGTPFLDANGVLGGSIIVGSVLGGIATAFVVKAKKGKY